MITLIIMSILTFLATEIDDFAIFVILYAQKSEKKISIFLGQFLAILIISLLCAFVSIPLSNIPEQYLRFVGIIPILVGILSFFEKEDEQKNINSSSMLLAAFLLTVAASADNIGVYIPFFANYTILQKSISILIFLLLQGLLSFLQIKTANIQIIQKIIEKTSKFLVPIVFILLGILIILNLL